MDKWKDYDFYCFRNAYLVIIYTDILRGKLTRGLIWGFLHEIKWVKKQIKISSTTTIANFLRWWWRWGAVFSKWHIGGLKEVKIYQLCLYDDWKKGCRGGSIMLATTKEIDKVRKIQFCFLFFQKNIIQNQWVL